MVADIARYHFLREPASSIAQIHAGIPEVHSRFWAETSIGDLYDIYRALQVSPAKVLALLDDGYVTNQSQERVYDYLQQFVGNMTMGEVRRFVTGSSVCSSRSIRVTFNAADGNRQCPVAHTCGQMSICYTSYLDFVNEFKTLLELGYWKMEVI